MMSCSCDACCHAVVGSNCYMCLHTISRVLACTQYCLPTDSPHLARHAMPLALAMSPLLWGRHKPDLFDSYSAGTEKSC